MANYDEVQNTEAPPKRRRRRHFDIYDARALLRMVVTLGVGGAVLWGVVLGDIWLWRLLYG